MEVDLKGATTLELVRARDYIIAELARRLLYKNVLAPHFAFHLDDSKLLP